MEKTKEISLEIGDVSADGWYCIGKKADGSPLEMSPPTIMTHYEASAAQQGEEKRLPSSGELSKMFNALTSNPEALAAIAAGKIQGLNRTGSYPEGRVWGAEKVEHTHDVALCLYSDIGNKCNVVRVDRAEARFVR